MTYTNPNDFLEIAETAVEQAGKKVAKIFHLGTVSIKRKYDYPGSIVTNADVASERLIISAIRRSGTRGTVISEEIGRLDLGGRDVVWAIDPLDGTFNFAKRIPYFAVSVGVRDRGRTVAAAIYNPILGEMFTASRGNGAHLNGKRITVSKTAALRNSSIIFEWWYPEQSIPDPLGLESEIYRYTRSLRSPGSIALNLCSVASGRFDGLITVFPKSPVYETAAGSIIVEEAGGTVTNSIGESWEGLTRSIIAAGPRLQRKLLAFVQSRG